LACLPGSKNGGFHFFIDSGAGQCICSCVDAFSEIRPCAIVIVGVSGNLPVHGVGTASFGVRDETGQLCIWTIHNCLLCHKNNGEEEFNLISVSQILRTRRNTVSFGSDGSVMVVKSLDHKDEFVFPLRLDDGLYSVDAIPMNPSDRRIRNGICLPLTLEVDSILNQDVRDDSTTLDKKTKAPSRLGAWYVRVLWVGPVRVLASMSDGFGEELKTFCQEYITPLPLPQNRKVYQVNDIEDMSDLSIRFFGIGTERLSKTLERSIGLSPMIKDKGKMRHRVPPHNFPQGAWKRGKTPRVSKGIVHDLHRASIGEVVFTDTFEVEDSGFRYGQAYVEYRSKYGEIIPLKSRSQVGWSFAEFCCQNFTPLILIRDNIGENIGGDLLKECLARTVKSAFICPYRKQQNYAEGYLGRICALATFGMVYAGAPMFMWRWCIACAVFVNNITATFYSEEDLWATPYEVLHNEPFPDSSVVVPFGCGVLVLLTDEEQGKFKRKCALMIFAHYANKHPLYTYAVYSPLTKRILYRQDCIFLTNLFPMRSARARDGLSLEGDAIIPYRSPALVRNGVDKDTSFRDWDISQPIPDFHDHVTGQQLNKPIQDNTTSLKECEVKEFVYPNNPRFGPASVVKIPTVFDVDEIEMVSSSHNTDDGDMLTLRPKRLKKKTTQSPARKRRPAKERWFYELVPEVNEAPANQDSMGNKEHKECLVGIQYLDKYEAAVALQPDPNLAKHVSGHSICSNKMLDEIPEVPKRLGKLDLVSESFLDAITIDEAGACSMQGIVFYDEELTWCRISGWGIESGIPIVFYLPTDADGSDAGGLQVIEEYASLTEVLDQIKQSSQQTVIPELEPSRILKRAPRQKALSYRLSGLKSALSTIGSVKVRQFGAKVGSYDGKVLSDRTIRRILRAQETIFKYGTLIPRNDAEANRSPEAKRWMSGKQLEWLRLQQANTFENQWTWERVKRVYPDYQKQDVGHLFFIYDYKFSGEHRVRLVFDGSRQSEATYNNTYAPTVRPESVRLFHIYAVEYSWLISQVDVPQAFLRSKADCDIFVYPPNGFAEYPGQLLKLSKMLYGSKQAAHLWYNLLNDFLLEIGFTASEMDPCFYRRMTIDSKGDQQIDALIILHVDDMRVAATECVIKDIHDKLFTKFEITTSDTGRFLGMDTAYDLKAGVLRMHMATYIQNTCDRFETFDISKGLPYREIVGSLLWIVLCIMGPELLRVKDLARRSNNFTDEDYADALYVLNRIKERKECGIIYRRNGAGKETVPRNTRLGGDSDKQQVALELPCTYSIGDAATLNELKQSDIYKLDDHEDQRLDIPKLLAPTNSRFTKVAYSDASFAVGESKQSITGFTVMINGTPILWGSLKQTVVVDSTCSAEYVAASVCTKQIMQVENMVQFLNFTCPKPYQMYTDSQACLQIANTVSKLGKVRHIEIRYHLVRCMIMAGDVRLEYCITEDMIADLFTKIVSGFQDKRLATRFYNDCNVLLFAEYVSSS
jgi:hypothetical protein